MYIRRLKATATLPLLLSFSPETNKRSVSIDISSNNQFSQGKRYKRIQAEIKVPSQVENSYCLDNVVRGLLTNHIRIAIRIDIRWIREP